MGGVLVDLFQLNKDLIASANSVTEHPMMILMMESPEGQKVYIDRMQLQEDEDLSTEVYSPYY